MRVETRKTVSGTEYWDTKEKRSVFVVAGEKPDFEVTVNPTSMIGEATHEAGTKVAEALKNIGEVVNKDEVIETNLDTMSAEQLLTFAEQNGIDVPGTMKKEETIRKHIADSLAADDIE